MKHGALWAGAVAILILAGGGYWVSRQETPSRAEATVALATPPGITLQARGGGRRAARAKIVDDLVYADAKGMTLYIYGKDTEAGKSACVEDCAKTWPPALAAADAKPEGDWSIIAREDGTKQWAYRGHPLYASTNDKAIGDVKGDNADGGAWHVATFSPGQGIALPANIAIQEVSDAGGQTLTDSAGLTLYAFDGDAKHPKSVCDTGGDCARHWVAFEAPAIANQTGDFAVIARDDGIAQWAYRGRPLYQFDLDLKAGDANGIGADKRFRVAMVARYFTPAGATITHNVQLGDILTTANGATLYQRDRATPGDSHDFRADHGSPALGRSLGVASCDEDCAKTWPPFKAPADALPSGYWDIATRPDGTRQWVYKGFALYTYSEDQPGDTRGNEIYDLAQVGDDAPVQVAGNARRAPVTGVDGVNDIPVVAGGAAAGAGVPAMFWHAVVP